MFKQEIDKKDFLVTQSGKRKDSENDVKEEKIRENHTGLPDNLKSGIEKLSGFGLDDVTVHYQSEKPAQLKALAYTEGTDIHIAPGQEKYLPHEAWHVVQQMQGRVLPTFQRKGMNINDDSGLEQEADMMGARAIHRMTVSDGEEENELERNAKFFRNIIQRKENVTLNNDTNIKCNIELKGKNDAVDKYKMRSKNGYSRGYIGTAIIYSGENGAEGLAKKYVEESNNWGKEERMSRLGVSFMFNHNNFIKETQDVEANNKVNITRDYLKINGISNVVELEKWCANYIIEGKNIAFDSKDDLFEKYDFWEVINKQSDEVQEEKQEDSEKNKKISNDRVIQILKSKMGEIPYGMLRTRASDNALKIKDTIYDNLLPEVEKKVLKRKVFIHSVDTDAPSFKTEDKDEKAVLNKYDELLQIEADSNKKAPAFLIGGYNLSANPADKDFSVQDHQDTMRSNMVDRIIRKAVFDKTESVVYPTEPNFLIKASTYGKLNEKKAPWGERASEGHNLLLNYMKYRQVKGKTFNRNTDFNKLKNGNADLLKDKIDSMITIIKGKQASDGELQKKLTKIMNQDKLTKLEKEKKKLEDKCLKITEYGKKQIKDIENKIAEINQEQEKNDTSIQTNSKELDQLKVKKKEIEEKYLKEVQPNNKQIEDIENKIAQINQEQYEIDPSIQFSKEELDQMINKIFETKESALILNDAASVPTGLDAGGQRLRVFAKKEYNEEIKGVTEKLVIPYFEGKKIQLGEQFAIQAQSWLNPDRIYLHWEKTAKQMKLQIDYNDIKKKFHDYFTNKITNLIIKIENSTTEEKIEAVKKIDPKTVDDFPLILFKSGTVINDEQRRMTDFKGMVQLILTNIKGYYETLLKEKE